MKTKTILGAWLVLAGLMVCNGIFRVALLTPLLGVESAEMMSVFTGIIIVFAAPQPFIARYAPQPFAQVWRTSIIWVFATIVFEAVLGVASGRTWSELIGAYSLWSGSFWPVILVAVGTSPFVWLLQQQKHTSWRVTK
jgi:ABC-type enterobactin transport system permease subunit